MRHDPLPARPPHRLSRAGASFSPPPLHLLISSFPLPLFTSSSPLHLLLSSFLFPSSLPLPLFSCPPLLVSFPPRCLSYPPPPQCFLLFSSSPFLLVVSSLLLLYPSLFSSANCLLSSCSSSSLLSSSSSSPPLLSSPPPSSPLLFCPFPSTLSSVSPHLVSLLCLSDVPSLEIPYFLFFYTISIFSLIAMTITLFFGRIS